MDLCKGIIPALLTPFDSTEKVNYPELRKHVRRLLDAGMHGIFCLGTNGEFYALSEMEKCKIVETVVDEVNGAVPVYAGSGDIATRTVIRLTNAFEAIGANAVSIVTPYFIQPSQHELYKHYARIADSTNLPIILYNIPMRTHVNLEADTVAALARDFTTIVGVKDSSGDINLTKSYIEKTPDTFCTIGGNDGLILETLKLGGTGAIAATANVIPEILVHLYHAFMQNNTSEAQEWQDRILPLRADFSLGTAPGVIKLQANLKGFTLGESRMPVLYDNEEIIERIKENLFKNYPTGN